MSRPNDFILEKTLLIHAIGREFKTEHSVNLNCSKILLSNFIFANEPITKCDVLNLNMMDILPLTKVMTLEPR